MRGTGAKPCPALPAGGCPAAAAECRGWRDACPAPGIAGLPLITLGGRAARHFSLPRCGGDAPKTACGGLVVRPLSKHPVPAVRGRGAAGRASPQPSHTPRAVVTAGRARECGGGSWSVPGQREGSCGERAAAFLRSLCQEKAAGFNLPCVDVALRVLGETPGVGFCVGVLDTLVASAGLCDAARQPRCWYLEFGSADWLRSRS